MYSIDEIKNRILQGDSAEVLKTLPSESIDCLITSPPYWALRDYKVDGQIGIEKTIDEYITNLINIFNECKRILKKTGTCWVVLGDTYSGGNRAKTTDETNYRDRKYPDKPTPAHAPNRIGCGIPDKSLCLIPERFSLKMIENKWILRNKIIWYKPNCMPSSAKDRYTVDYENIYFFTKSQRYYFKTQYESYTDITLKEINQKYNGKGIKDYEDNGVQNPSDVKRRIINSLSLGRIKRCVWKINTKPFSDAHFAVFPEELVKQCLDAGCSPNGITLDPFMGLGYCGIGSPKERDELCRY